MVGSTLPLPSATTRFCIHAVLDETRVLAGERGLKHLYGMQFEIDCVILSPSVEYENRRDIAETQCIINVF